MIKNKQRNRSQPGVRAKFDQKTGLVRLNVPLSVKADSINTTDRTFEGLAATWAEDLGQDIIHKGAFKSSIIEWKSSGEAMPLINSHDHFDIFSAIGQAISMKENSDGLLTLWEVIEGEDGDRVLTRIRPSPRTGRAIIGKMSIGFVPTKYSYEQPPGTESYFDRIRHITEADLKEVSLVLFPMNPGACIDATSVKSFMQMARDTDPKTLDAGTRMELRRLNSRIGLLLKKQKAEDDEEDVEEEEEAQSTPPTPPADAEDLGDDTDDSEDSTDEDTEEEEGTEEDTPPEPKAKETPVPVTKDKKEENEPAPYQYGEALQKRLLKVTLQQKISHTQSDA